MIDEEVQTTARTGMLHLQKMPDVEFVQFIQHIGRTLHGQLSNLEVSLKVDGAGARFGVSSDGRPFFEGSRTGPIFEPGAFTAHARSRGSSDEIVLRAGHYDEIWRIITSSQFVQTLPPDTKIVCELFYNPMGEVSGEGIKFVTINYDQEKLGRVMTIVPFDVLVASTGESHPDSNAILVSLFKQSNDSIKFVNADLKTAGPIDISGFIDPIMSLGPEATATLQSRKRDDAAAKENLKQIIQSVKDELAEYILTHPNILDKFKLGPNIEGLVLNINGRLVKVTTSEFKAHKAAERQARAGQVREMIESIMRPGEIPHPEDSIFEGVDSATTALKELMLTVQEPNRITIKWDGKPALVFGRDANGKLSVSDKYMFDKGVLADSPRAWEQYDQQKSSAHLRPDLYRKLGHIWPGLEAAVGNNPGYFWGDLLWAGALTPTNGQYHFRPNTVEYSVDANSPLGKQIATHTGGVVVHQYFAEPGSKSVPWNGQGLNKNDSVAILTANAGLRFRVNEPVQLLKATAAAIKTHGSAANGFLKSADTDTIQAIKTYTNKRITGQAQEDLLPWLQNNGHETAAGYVKYQSAGAMAVLSIWSAIYQLKENLVQQLNRQVVGIHQQVNGKPEGEGFVVNTPAGQIKLVNRGVFSAANFAHNP
jgi:hypothetical protein